MSKNKIERHPIPDNHGRAFMATVWTMARAFGIDKIPAACRYFQLASDEIDRALFEQKNPVVTRFKEDAERKKFITIFKGRYLQLTDLEYNSVINPMEARMISQVCVSLIGKGFSPEEYLQWLFDDFLPLNDKFVPPPIKFTCSGFTLNKFLYERKDQLKQKKDEALRSQLYVDLVNRARVCMRQNPDEKEKLVRAVEKFTSGGIMLEDMRKLVEGYEEAYKQKQANGQAEIINENTTC